MFRAHRIVNVSLTRCSTRTVLPAFARCLDALPNVHTLQIFRAHSQMTTALKEVFEGRSYPHIQTAVLPTLAHNVLRCCPAARTVICNAGDGSQLVTALAKGRKKVERLEGFDTNINLMKRE